MLSFKKKNQNKIFCRIYVCWALAHLEGLTQMTAVENKQHLSFSSFAVLAPKDIKNNENTDGPRLKYE